MIAPTKLVGLKYRFVLIRNVSRKISVVIMTIALLKGVCDLIDYHLL